MRESKRKFEKFRGVSAVNQDFKKYDGVNKDHTYRLVEGEGVEEFDESFKIRTCDMRKFFHGGNDGKDEFAGELGKGLEQIGFAVLSGHGIESSIYRNAENMVRSLFESTTLEERERFLAKRVGSVNQGYFPIKETTIIHPDLVEGWVFCRRAFDLGHDPDYAESDFWPRPGYEPVFRDLIEKQEKLILPVMQSILRYLNCDPHLFDKRLTNTNFGFRLNYYPPLTEEDEASGAGRMLGHEDVDLFTLLPAQNVDGLQVFNRENGKWIRLNPPPGTIILNTGDYMQRISNDRFLSTTHRVSKPGNRDHYRTPRVSMPMAVYVWEDQILEVLPGLGKPKYGPVSALEFHTAITSKYYGDGYAVKTEGTQES